MTLYIQNFLRALSSASWDDAGFLTNKKLTIYPSKGKYYFFTSPNKALLSEPRLAGSLGIDQSQSQAASLSTGRSAEDDTFSDRALSMTALE